jgi:hypothetical protein
MGAAPARGGPDLIDWYVSPTGTATNDGSLAAPIDLATALDGRRVKPGSTVWLRGGVYRGPVTSSLLGTPQAPITVRPYADERAIVSDHRSVATGATINVRGAWTIFRDFEVTNSNASRRHQGSFRPMGFEVQAPNTKFVNLVIHDCGMGFGLWKEAVDAELYGNVLFNNGTDNTVLDSRHGHAVYTQNDTGTKLIRDNVIVNQFGFGIHAYPNPGNLTGFRFEGNVVANSGAAGSSAAASRYSNILVSGYRPYRVDRVELIENFTYHSARNEVRGHFTEANVCLGCTDPQVGNTVIVKNNYFAGGAPVMFIGAWQHLTMRGNTYVGLDGMAMIKPPSEAAMRQWDWDDNSYLGTGPKAGPAVLFSIAGRLLGYRDWVATTGFDKVSRHVPGRPAGTRVFVRPNHYETGRANVIVYNWDHAGSVDVDLGEVLRAGTYYEVLSGVDYLGQPVAAGRFEGGGVKIPMTDLRTVKAGGTDGAPVPGAGEFGVFVVRTVSQLRPAQPNASSTASTSARPDLRMFIGRFVAQDPPGEVRVELGPAGLHAVIMNEPGNPTYALRSVAPNRFRFEGTPEGYFATFELADGKVTSLRIERREQSPVTLFPR